MADALETLLRLAGSKSPASDRKDGDDRAPRVRGAKGGSAAGVRGRGGDTSGVAASGGGGAGKGAMRGSKRGAQGRRSAASPKEKRATERFVRLAHSHADDREVTIYVRGFLARGEKPDHFDAWLETHRTLVAAKNWGPRAYGYSWPSGRFRTVPLPVATSIAGAWRVYQKSRNVRRMAGLGPAVGLIAAEEVVQVVGRFLFQYAMAVQAAEQRAHMLAERLAKLRSRYERVRVVAHSLGCRHIIEASSSLAGRQRPDEIHLCAPACRERDVAPKLAGLARGSTYVYYCKSDAVLDVGFRLVARGRAVGSKGLTGGYAGMSAVDVSEHFGFWVHPEYKNRFSQFARGN